MFDLLKISDLKSAINLYLRPTSKCMQSKFFIILLFLSIANIGLSQERLKSKYYGEYKGKINSYKMETAGYLMDVEEVKISVEIGPSLVRMKIGKLDYNGTYEILFEAKEYYVIEVKLTDQPIPERIVIYKKGKKVSRDGLYPQPNALLFKD